MLELRLNDATFNEGKDHYLSTIKRKSARGVLYDDEMNVSLLLMGKTGFHKLPGGGVEPHEDIETAFKREVLEETGCNCNNLLELGYVEEHKLKNGFLQYSYCYMAKKLGNDGETAFTDKEKMLGFSAAWYPLQDALAIMEADKDRCTDYSTRFMLTRDYNILKYSCKFLESEKK